MLLARESGIFEDRARRQIVALARLGLLRLSRRGRGTRHLLP
jgi:hypothetical protein